MLMPLPGSSYGPMVYVKLHSIRVVDVTAKRAGGLVTRGTRRCAYRF